MRKPKGTAGTQVIEEEELLLLYTVISQGYWSYLSQSAYLADFAVVTPGCLGQERLVFAHLFLVGEGYTIYTL
jgi:hypothetical protein